MNTLEALKGQGIATEKSPVATELPTSSDLRQVLIAEFDRRRRVNRRYSLRAFAKALGVESSYLSKVLRGKREITQRLLRRLERPLRLNEGVARRLSAGIAEDESRRRGTARVLRLEVLPEDTFRVIAEWYHYAILEATQLVGFRPDASYLAKKLQIPETVAQEALDRLLRLQLIRENEEGRWVTTNHTTVGHPFSTEAFRKLQRGVLERALVALETMPIETRDQTSITVATDRTMMPEVKERIRRFRRELAVFLDSAPEKNTVYHFSFSAYPVTTDEVNS